MARQVAAFLDLDNIYWGLSNFYEENSEEMIMHIIDKIWDTYKDDKVRIFSAYADFERVPRIQTEIQKKGSPQNMFLVTGIATIWLEMQLTLN